ncbi:MAG: prepilin-type N-terminal cleavage/methylation domain-containing protein [bacterium]
MISRHAFTLIELLIVVAIIGILAAIAVPNFLNAQVRAKVSRAVSDMRNISLALETYRLDNNAYPAWGGLYPNQLRYIRLTTPTAYMSSIPQDPFVNSVNEEEYLKTGNAYDYVDRDPSAWGHLFRLSSWGPDGKNSYAGSREFTSVQQACPNGAPVFVYNPSNGLGSYGDIVWAGPKDDQMGQWYCAIQNGI